jgi:hypothetical protein
MTCGHCQTFVPTNQITTQTLVAKHIPSLLIYAASARNARQQPPKLIMRQVWIQQRVWIVHSSWVLKLKQLQPFGGRNIITSPDAACTCTSTAQHVLFAHAASSRAEVWRLTLKACTTCTASCSHGSALMQQTTGAQPCASPRHTRLTQAMSVS